jgi:hypothetical protein
LIVGDQAKEALDLIDPGRRSLRIVHMPEGALGEPVADRLGRGSIIGYRSIVRVIPPFLVGFWRRIHAASCSFWAGVMPPMPMFGRSWL